MQDATDVTWEFAERRAGCGHRPVRPGARKALSINALTNLVESDSSKLLILWILRGWLAALDDFRNWLIREAA
jgi:hypothetical protein